MKTIPRVAIETGAATPTPVSRKPRTAPLLEPTTQKNNVVGVCPSTYFPSAVSLSPGGGAEARGQSSTELPKVGKQPNLVWSGKPFDQSETPIFGPLNSFDMRMHERGEKRPWDSTGKCSMSCISHGY